MKFLISNMVVQPGQPVTFDKIIIKSVDVEKGTLANLYLEGSMKKTDQTRKNVV